MQNHENARKVRNLLNRPLDFLRIYIGVSEMKFLEGVVDCMRATLTRHHIPATIHSAEGARHEILS